MSKFTFKAFSALAGGALLLAGSFAVAAPASANTARTASCSAIGGVYTAGNNASNDRCIVTTTTTGAPVAGTPVTATIFTDLGETYLSTLPVRLERGEPVASHATVHGDWAITDLKTSTSCAYAGKSKVQKCTATTSAIESRDIFSVTTLSTPLYDVHEVLQDRQSVTTGTQPTTVTTTTRTVTYRFAGDAIANQQSDVSGTSSAAGDPIAIYEVGDTIVVKVGEQKVAAGTDVDVLEPVKSGTELAEPYVVSSITCVINGSKQTIRDNSCPEPTPVA